VLIRACAEGLARLAGWRYCTRSDEVAALAIGDLGDHTGLADHLGVPKGRLSGPRTVYTIRPDMVVMPRSGPWTPRRFARGTRWCCCPFASTA
jgi:hypothetical protein